MTKKEIREALVKRIQERLDDENIKKIDDKLADYSNRYGDKKINIRSLNLRQHRFGNDKV